MAVAAVGEGRLHGFPASFTGHVGEPVGPCLFRGCVDGVLDVDDEPARGAQCGADAIDVGHDVARGRNLGGLSLGHESVLQIDHDMRGTRGIDVVENVQRLAALQNTVDGGLG